MRSVVAVGHTPALGRLKKRAQFLAVAGARRRYQTASLTLQVRRHEAGELGADREPLLRIGFTASKKVGNAVTRNRAKRRLREAARLVLAPHARPGHDLVMIAKPETAILPWSTVTSDVALALRRLGLWRDDGPPKAKAG